MKKVAILLEKLFEDNELHYPKFRLREAGYHVNVIAPNADETYSGKHGTTQKPDRAASDAKAEEYDLIVIPGGFSPDHMRRSEHLVKFARAAADAGTPMAAICHGAWLLCSTKALKGRRCTSFMSIADDCRNAGATWVDEACVVDANIITARTPDDLPAFMQAVLATLNGETATGTKGTPIAPAWVREASPID